MTARLDDYAEVRAYLEKKHPDWLRALTPRYIKAQADYYKSAPLIPGATFKQAFQQASSVPFSLIVDDEVADNEEGVDLSAEDFVDKLWLLAITLLLIMVSGENLIEHGRLEKKRKPKSGVKVSRWNSGHRIFWVGSTSRHPKPR